MNILVIFRNYASGACLEKIVEDSMDVFIAEVKRDGAEGKPFDIKPHLVLLVINFLCGVMFGKTYDIGDPTITCLLLIL